MENISGIGRFASASHATRSPARSTHSTPAVLDVLVIRNTWRARSSRLRIDVHYASSLTSPIVQQFVLVTSYVNSTHGRLLFLTLCIPIRTIGGAWRRPIENSHRVLRKMRKSLLSLG